MDRTQILLQAEQAYKEEDYQATIDFLSSIPEPDAEVYFNRAIALTALKRFPEAYNDMKQAFRLNPKGPGITLNLGNLAVLMGENKDAIIWYRKAREIKEDAVAAKEKLDELMINVEAEEKAKPKKLRFVETEKKFSDVIGGEAVKEKLREQILLAIEEPALYKKYDKKIGYGILLYGPPGCGKTLLAEALAGEATGKIKFSNIGINQVLNMYVGNSEKNVGLIFAEARENAPCILFFDEFDALGKSRSGSNDKASDAGTTSKVVDQLLAEMQGVGKNLENIFVIGATNMPWEVDSALKRSGRFSTICYIPPPSYRDRVALFKLYMKKAPHSSLDYGRLARATMGYSQADIASLCDNAKLMPLLKEYKTKKTGVVTTGAILRQIAKERSTLDLWFPEQFKSLLGTTKTEGVQGKKVVSWQTGKLNAEEKKLYSEMIDTITRNSQPTAVFIKKVMRTIALYIA
jgi:SpoVK/Ycf46/Vps4 family AAA+-type ATPase